jgi:hypothetical protein
MKESERRTIYYAVCIVNRQLGRFLIVKSYKKCARLWERFRSLACRHTEETGFFEYASVLLFRLGRCCSLQDGREEGCKT